MQNYSVTQGTNIAAFIASLSIFVPLVIKLFTTFGEFSAEDWSQLGASGTVVVTSLISFVNRLKKGDVTVLGNIKA
jgi:hypothetical protein